MIGARVILVDDHTIVRKGLAALLQSDGRYRVVAEARNGEEALVCAASTPAELIVLDLSMPRMNGFETIRRIAHKSSRLGIVVLSMHDDTQFVAEALREGARGYILKEALDDELFSALDAVAKGEVYVSSLIDMTRVREHIIEAQDLTSREREVLQLIAEGHTTHTLAKMLQISPHTATRHRSNLMQKLNTHNQMELVRVAAKKGLIILK